MSELNDNGMSAERELLIYKREKENNRRWLDLQVQQMAMEIKNGLAEEMDKVVSEGNKPIIKKHRVRAFFENLRKLWRREF